MWCLEEKQHSGSHPAAEWAIAKRHPVHPVQSLKALPVPNAIAAAAAVGCGVAAAAEADFADGSCWATCVEDWDDGAVSANRTADTDDDGSGCGCCCVVLLWPLYLALHYRYLWC